MPGGSGSPTGRMPQDRSLIPHHRSGVTSSVSPSTVIDPAPRPVGYQQFSTFHPTFLYESLYLLAILGVLLQIERRRTMRRGQSVADRPIRLANDV